MFSENHKISCRQAYRLLVYDFLGIGTLLIPTAAAKYAGRDGVFGILAGLAAALLYLKILSVLLKDMKNESYAGYLARRCPKWLAWLIRLGYLLCFAAAASCAAYVFALLVVTNLVKGERFALILFLLLVLSFYGMAGGIEGRARVYEVLFWFLMLPLFVMLLFACREVDTAYWCPVFTASGSGICKSGGYVFFCYLPVSLVLFLREHMAKGQKTARCAQSAILFSSGVLLALYLILVGLFGSAALSGMQFPAVTLMSRVQVTGGFLKRTDAFMFGIWFFTLYALLNSMVYYGGSMLRSLVPAGWNRNGKKEMASYAILLAAVYALALCFYMDETVRQTVVSLLMRVGTAFIVGVPVLLCVTGRFRFRKKMAVAALVLFSGSLLLQGCRTAELEDKEFPVLLNITADGDFAMKWLDYEHSGNRTVDYNHLKVVLIERAFFEDEAAMDEMLTLFEKENELPQNAYVCVTEDCEALAESYGEQSVSLGTYIEEMIENTSGVCQDIYPTLGMLYQERENHLETLFLPYIEAAADGMPAVTAYGVWKRGNAQGFADTKTALLSFFTQGATREYTLKLSVNCFVELTSQTCRITQETEENGSGKSNPVVTVTVSGEGKLLNGTVGSCALTTEEALNAQAEDYFNATASAALADGTDVTNSYKLLGGNAREWYFTYENAPESYERDITIRYRVQIHWKND